MVTWILVAHRAGARLFKSDGPARQLERIKVIPHPVGRAHDRDLGSDKPGRVFSLGNPARSGIDRGTEPGEHLARVFAGELAALIEEGRTHQLFDKLILVAEPRFLGKLRSALTPSASNMIVATLGKDLGGHPDEDLPAHLTELMDIWEAALVSTGT